MYGQWFIFLCFTLISATAEGRDLPRKVYRKDGDLIIGGLVPLHNFNDTTERCSEARDIGALRLVEAIVFAISSAELSELNGLTLGYEIYDTCSSTSETLWNSLAFIPPVREKNNVIGVVGPQRSSSSIQATKLLGLYEVPVVSYLSTSDELSKSGKYPYFLRTVPPDTFQINVIVDILTMRNWTYVAFIYSDDSYGQNARSEFLEQTESLDICVGYSYGIPMTTTGDAYDRALTNLMKERTDSLLSVVILFIHFEMASNLFSSAFEQGIYREFIWIGSDAWGNYGAYPVINAEEVALGAFTITPKSYSLPSFDGYFRDMSLTSSNPWLGDFTEEVEACKVNADNCGNDDERPHFESMIVEAVHAYIHAIEEMVEEICTGPMSSDDCATKIIEGRTRFKDALMDVSVDNSGNGLLEFTENGDAVGRYDIRQLQLVDNDYKFLVIGNWSQGSISMELGEYYLRENADETRYNEGIPKSICNDPCGAREIEIPKGCCWSCVSCETGQIANGSECVNCYDPDNDSYQWPDEQGIVCVPLPLLGIIDTPESLIVIGISLLMIVLEITVAVLYIKNRDAKLIRASSRELCYIILFGVFLTLLCAMTYAIPSSFFSCVFVRFVPYIALSLTFIPVATMTVRLHRIFQAGKRSTKRPKFISPVSQITLSLGLTMIPLIWGSVWVVLDPPHVIREKAVMGKGVQYLDAYCRASYPQLLGNLLWHFLTVSVCCYFAVETRNLPANYNQSRFIAFTSFCTLVVFIAFTPAYFLTSDSRARELYSSLGALLQSAVVLILLFVIKLYAVYFVNEEKQVVIPTTQAQPSNDVVREARKSEIEILM